MKVVMAVMEIVISNHKNDFAKAKEEVKNE